MRKQKVQMIQRLSFFPLWRFEKLEHWLEAMEAQGWRLQKVQWGFWFSFRMGTPKQVRYVWMGHDMKRKEPFELWEQEHHLRSAWNAESIESSMTNFELYRLIRTDADLTEFQKARVWNWKRLLRGRFRISVLGTALTLVVNLMEPRLFLICLLCGAALSTVYYGIGILKAMNV